MKKVLTIVIVLVVAILSGVGNYQYAEEYKTKYKNNDGANKFYCESLWSRGTFVLARRLEYVWELYKKCKKECQTQYESESLCKLAEKEESIKDLESSLADSNIKERYLRDEVAQYRKLLDEIQLALKTIS